MMYICTGMCMMDIWKGIDMMDMYRYGYDGYMYRYGYDRYSIGMDMMGIGGRAGKDCSYRYWSDTTCRWSVLSKMGLLISYNLII